MGRDAVGNAVGLWAMTMIDIWDHMETSVEKLSVLFHFVCHNPVLHDRLRQQSKSRRPCYQRPSNNTEICNVLLGSPLNLSDLAQPWSEGTNVDD